MGVGEGRSGGTDYFATENKRIGTIVPKTETNRWKLSFASWL